jgi:hypothetical protein
MTQRQKYLSWCCFYWARASASFLSLPIDSAGVHLYWTRFGPYLVVSLRTMAGQSRKENVVVCRARACVCEAKTKTGWKRATTGLFSTRVCLARPGFRCEMGCCWLAEREENTLSVVNFIWPDTRRQKEYNLTHKAVFLDE